MFDPAPSRCHRLLVRATDPGVDIGLMLGKKGVDVGDVDCTRALGLREDEVEEREGADVGVEGKPTR